MREIEYKILNKCFDNYNLTQLKAININNLFKDDNIIFLQYTGLKDKLWNKIFEWDILKYLEQDWWSNWIVEFDSLWRYIVKWNRDEVIQQSTWRIETKEHTTELHNYDNMCEIIWNIYEDKELLIIKNKNEN